MFVFSNSRELENITSNKKQPVRGRVRAGLNIGVRISSSVAEDCRRSLHASLFGPMSGPISDVNLRLCLLSRRSIVVVDNLKSGYYHPDSQ